MSFSGRVCMVLPLCGSLLIVLLPAPLVLVEESWELPKVRERSVAVIDSLRGNWEFLGCWLGEELMFVLGLVFCTIHPVCFLLFLLKSFLHLGTGIYLGPFGGFWAVFETSSLSVFWCISFCSLHFKRCW